MSVNTFRTPLEPIVKQSKGRVAQLELGVGENQPVRVSDFNPVIEYLNSRAGVNQGTGTAVSSAVTINSLVGTITSEALTTAVGAIETITVTNSFVNSNSVIFAQLSSYSGTYTTDGNPVITQVRPSTGSFTVDITNIAADATGHALDGFVTIKFIIF